MSVCKYCYRPITKAVLAEKKRRKVENARSSAIKAKANGNSGRKRLRDDKLIRKLRDSGLSIRAVAKQAGVSASAVQRSLKEAGIK